MVEPGTVAKFGGNCVSSADMYGRIAKILQADRSRKFVVVSAIAGVTDSLVASLAKPREEKEIDHYIADLRRKHLALLPDSCEDSSVEAIGALTTKLERLLYGIAYTEETTPRSRDFVLSFGERLAAQVVAANLGRLGVDARAHEADAIGLFADDTYGNASALLDETRARLAPFLRREAQAGHVSVITGFFGLSQDGKPATFGRGGSDYSAAVVAYALELPTIEIWRDVGGFMSADPKIVPEAFPLSALSYDEAAELSYFGAKALHPRSVQPARACGASIVLKDAGTNVYSAATSQTCIALLVDADGVSRAKKTLARLPPGLIDRIEVLAHVSLISFVGEGLGYAHGVAARVFRAVAERGINVQLISAGASMVAYTFTVDDRDLEKAVQAVHKEFFGNGSHDPGRLARARGDRSR